MNKDVLLQSLDKAFPRRELRDLAADCHLPREKDLIHVDQLFLRVPQSCRQRRSQRRFRVAQKRENCCHCPRWCQSKGNVELLTDHANFSVEGVSDLGRNPRSLSVWHNIFGKVERMNVSLKKGRYSLRSKVGVWS